MTLIFRHTPSLVDCDESILEKVEALNDSEPEVRLFSFPDLLVPISILNRQTNTNTFYNHRVTLYIRNEPFHSASLSDYDACALPTKASHYASMNSSNTLTIVDTTYLFQRVHAITRIETLKPSHTTTNQPSRVPLVITYNPSLRSISGIIQKHFKIPLSSPRCNNIFQTTPFVAFRRTDNLRDILNYVLINKLTSPRDPFDAAKIALPAAISPMAVQITPFLPLGK